MANDRGPKEAFLKGSSSSLMINVPSKLVYSALKTKHPMLKVRGDQLPTWDSRRGRVLAAGDTWAWSDISALTVLG